MEADWGPLCLTVGHASDIGLRRSENQDALGFRMPTGAGEAERLGALFVVCDGIGGFEGGRKASRAAVHEFIRGYFECDEKALPSGARPPAASRLREASRRANTMVYEEARREHALGRMGTTLVAAAVLGGDAWVLNVGDSRAYLWRAGELRRLSRDHVPRRRGVAARAIDRAVGTDPHVEPFVRGPVSLSAGDRLLLCTDGLTTAVPESVIVGFLEDFSPSEAARQLIERAKTAGAEDNVSVMVVAAERPEAEHAAKREGARDVLRLHLPAGRPLLRQAAPLRMPLGAKLKSGLARARATIRDPVWRRRWIPWLYVVAVLLVLLVGLFVGRLLAR